MSDEQELVTLTIDEKEVKVPKGTNLIAAAAAAGIEIPHYCYHENLSVAGNCRMCQVQVEGMPKLTIGCNTGAQEGMVVRTQRSSDEVAEAQRATLEFLLINHPLDCTVCDQAGHCKLQDYYYEYNTQASRFTEEKVNQVKAEPLGPDIIYDGERCIVCTRCVRFCDEVSETSELGVFNRGDKSVIGISADKELDNPLSGCVVDLCPVGALTHRPWRFNTRIWYTNSADTVCAGCSTGCNATAHVRDGAVVQVKARNNQDVNQEWMCNEGRYGFDRFQPSVRALTPSKRNGANFVEASWDEALGIAKGLSGNSAEDAAVFLSPLLTTEEVWSAVQFAQNVMGVSAESGRIAMQIRSRELSEVEAKLISPDYAPNARAAGVFGISSTGDDWREALEGHFNDLLGVVAAGGVKRILFVGDRSIVDSDVRVEVARGIADADCSVAITSASAIEPSMTEAFGPGMTGFHQCSVALPGRTVNEKNGLMINKDRRVQRLKSLLTGPFGTYPEWMLLERIAEACGKKVLPAGVTEERALSRAMIEAVADFSGMTLMSVGELGQSLDEQPAAEAQASEDQGASA